MPKSNAKPQPAHEIRLGVSVAVRKGATFAASGGHQRGCELRRDLQPVARELSPVGRDGSRIRLASRWQPNILKGTALSIAHTGWARPQPI